MTHRHTHAGAGQEQRHSHSNYADRSHPEFVLLNIGGDTGALVLHTDPDLHGVEIEISPAGDDHSRSHKQVLERSIRGRAAFTAVYDDLREGMYTLWVDGEPRACDVQITGGAVSQVDWRVTAGRVS